MPTMDRFDDEYIETLYAAPRGAPVLVLRHQFGSLAGTSHTFRSGRVHLGRRRDCEVHFDSHMDRMVSARHACIEEADGRWILEDLGSTNGTFVNGREIHGRVSLAHGDQVVLGSDDSDGSVGFFVEMTEDSAPRESETRTATAPRDPGREPPRESRAPPRPEPARVETKPAPLAQDSSIEIGGPLPDPAEIATLRGELKALEITVPATRAAAEMAARTLAEAAWHRGGVDWSSCPSIAAVLESERQAREAEANAAQFASERAAGEAASEARLAAVRDAVAVAEARLAELEAQSREATDRIAAENATLATHCDPLFNRLDELSLVISEVVAKHRPDVDDDVLEDLAEMKRRMSPLISALEGDGGAVGEAIARRKADVARVAELGDSIASQTAQLDAAKQELTRVETEERHAAAERAQQNDLAQRSARERSAELAARFAALGAEAVRLALPGIVDGREFGSASAALGALATVEKRIAELRALLARSGTRGAGEHS